MTTPVNGADGGAPERGRKRPSPAVVEAAKADYARAKDQLEEFTGKVRDLLAAGWTDFEAVAEVYGTMRTQPGTQMTLLSAVALVRLAKTPTPSLGELTE
ncbi:hypothetical protein [Paractinoplanes rishiriensis]|uniref:Uncharacterized protein n=1 Tax=Paractinoplanes rishiriensis TaxID=1050105 RepID=A0A919MNC3_9ACTN|nr:hypothetical protein [Actinoplanes rishiriensis]GIE93876.1 hypothetical protein Ari01nite_13410 [Actinoplanes rishiriensis]